MIHHGDCIEVMRTMPDASVDSICTDPPYGLGFMGKAWDELPPGEEWARECLRVLKPGGHMLAFGGTRTWHRLAVAVEDAGFEIRDSIAWMYGSGFPKSLDVSKAIDKAAGAEREVMGFGPDHAKRTIAESGTIAREGGASPLGQILTAPATPDAERWQGWGSAMKPAFEPVVVARKPLIGTIAQNVLLHGTGALNVDACRITSTPTTRMDVWGNDASRCDSCAEPVAPNARRGTSATRGSTAIKPAEQTLSERVEPSQADTSKTDTGCSAGTKVGDTSTSSSTGLSGSSTTGPSLTASSSTTSTTTHSTIASRTCSSCRAPITTPTTTGGPSAGRWPSNVVLDESQAEALDEQSGTCRSSGLYTRGPVNSGGPAAIKIDRDGYTSGQYADSGGASRFFYVAKAPKSERPTVDGIAHPTVKPLALMRWLVRLVTPPGGIVLDPFAGSGTTIEAALLEGFQPIGIEREVDYLPLIEARIERASEQLGLFGGDAA